MTLQSPDSRSPEQEFPCQDVPGIVISRRRPNEQPKAEIAQLVEQLAFNQLVLGSSPSLRTFSFRLWISAIIANPGFVRDGFKAIFSDFAVLMALCRLRRG